MEIPKKFDIKDCIIESKKPFKLSSGQKSSIYYDFRRILVDSELLFAFSEVFLDVLWDGIDHYNGGINVIGLEMWGMVYTTLLPHISWTAGEFYIPILLRKSKSHGLDQRLIGLEHHDPKEQFVVIDDVLTSGKTLTEAITYLQRIKIPKPKEPLKMDRILHKTIYKVIRVVKPKKRLKIRKILVVMNRSNPLIEEILGVPVQSVYHTDEKGLPKRSPFLGET